MSTLAKQVIGGDARAWGKVADIVRAKGGTYNDTFDVVCGIFRKAGKEAPTRAEFEDMMLEADYLETQEG